MTEVGWDLRVVSYIEERWIYDGSQDNLLKGVFTNLSALALIVFIKVVMLDVDHLVRSYVDHLFNRDAAAALKTFLMLWDGGRELWIKIFNFLLLWPTTIGTDPWRPRACPSRIF